LYWYLSRLWIQELKKRRKVNIPAGDERRIPAPGRLMYFSK
jgi:hypothetical protein